MNMLSRASRWTRAMMIAVTALVASETVHSQSTPDFVPVTDAMLQAPAPEDWLMWRRTLDSWGFSPLDEITRDNVDQLRMVWTRALTEGFQSGTPLVYLSLIHI